MLVNLSNIIASKSGLKICEKRSTLESACFISFVFHVLQMRNIKVLLQQLNASWCIYMTILHINSLTWYNTAFKNTLGPSEHKMYCKHYMYWRIQGILCTITNKPSFRPPEKPGCVLTQWMPRSTFYLAFLIGHTVLGPGQKPPGQWKAPFFASTWWNQCHKILFVLSHDAIEHTENHREQRCMLL